MKAIVVGLGGMGRLWTEYLTRYASWEVVAAADLSEEAISAYRNALEFPRECCFRELESALESVEADTVIITTPAERHKECIIAGLKSGLNVVTEKPAVTKWEDAVEVAELARKSRGKLMVSQNYRYYHSALALRRFVREGTAGAPCFARVIFQRGGTGRPPKTHAAQHGEPFLIEMAIHHFDTMRAVLDVEPVAVYAESWRPGWSGWLGNANAICLFQFEEDVRVNYFGAWATWHSHTEFPGSWVIDFEKGQLTWDGYDVTYFDTNGDQHVVFERSQTPTERAVRVLEGSVAEFASALEAGREPETNMEDNLKTLAMVFGSIESGKSGRVVGMAEFI